MRGVELWGYAYPWDLESGGAATAVAERLAIDTVAVAAAYHSVRAATPLHRDRRLVEATSSAAYFPLRDEVWRGRRLVPANPTWAAPDAFVAACAAVRRAHRRPAAWVVLTHNSRLATAFPDLAVRNAFGDHYPHALCPSHPEVREYAATLTAEAVRAGDVDRVVLEACAALGAVHGAAHDKSATALDGGRDVLLSLCFCSACRSALAAAGVDAERCAKRIRVAVRDDDVVTPADLLGADVVDALIGVRSAGAAALLDEVTAAVLAVAGATEITVHSSTRAWDFTASGTPPVVAGRAAVTALWVRSPEDPAILPTGGGHGAVVELTNPAWDDPATGAALLGRLVAAGVDRIHVYHLGLLRRRQVTDLAGALACARAVPPSC